MLDKVQNYPQFTQSYQQVLWKLSSYNLCADSPDFRGKSDGN